MVEVAREVAAGRVDLSQHEPAWERLLRIRNIGPWTVEKLAFHGQGRDDMLPAGDLAYVKLVGRMLRMGRRATVEEVRDFFAPYAPFEGLPVSTCCAGSVSSCPRGRRSEKHPARAGIAHYPTKGELMRSTLRRRLRRRWRSTPGNRESSWLPRWHSPPPPSGPAGIRRGISRAPVQLRSTLPQPPGSRPPAKASSCGTRERRRGQRSRGRAQLRNAALDRRLRLSMPDLRPQLAFDPKGAALAIWSYFTPHPRFVEDGYAVDYTFGLKVASRSAATRGFGRAQTLTDRLDADPSADAAFDDKGNAVVIWTDEAGMHAAARPAGKRRFSRAQVISQTQADPQVTVGASGTTAAWARRQRGARRVGRQGRRVRQRRRVPDSGTGQGEARDRGRRASGVTAAWSTKGRVMAATCRSTGHCGPARAVSPSGRAGNRPARGGGKRRHGRARLAVPERRLRGRAQGPPALRSARAPRKARRRPEADRPRGAVGTNGDAAAMWLVHGPDGDSVQAALRHGPRARFAKASALTGDVPGSVLESAADRVDAKGNALAVWGAMVDGHPSIQAATFDAN